MASRRLFRVFINLERVSLGCARASVKRAFMKAQSGWRIRYNTFSVVQTFDASCKHLNKNRRQHFSAFKAEKLIPRFKVRAFIGKLRY